MDWRKKVFEGFRLYAVTGLQKEDPEILKKIEQAYRGGTDIVQLRSKVLTDAALIRLGFKVRKIALRYRKLFFINDRVDLALALDADGVHLGQDDMPVAVARSILGEDKVYDTPTKPCAKSVGLKFVKQAAARIRIPWVAIGGIDLTNLSSVVDAGAARIAVVRAIFSAKDPEVAARKFELQLEGN